MENEVLVSIQKLLEELLKKEEVGLSSSTITVLGMIGVAILTSITQLIITKKVIFSEHERIKLQLDSEFKLRQHENWQTRFQNIASALLTELDPELNKNIDNERQSVEQIHKIQMMLNLKIPSHLKLNTQIQELGLAINNKKNIYTHSALLQLHGDIVDSIREIIFQDNSTS